LGVEPDEVEKGRDESEREWREREEREERERRKGRETERDARGREEQRVTVEG
jgi:hypothetical protein